MLSALLQEGGRTKHTLAIRLAPDHFILPGPVVSRQLPGDTRWAESSGAVPTVLWSFSCVFHPNHGLVPIMRVTGHNAFQEPGPQQVSRP